MSHNLLLKLCGIFDVLFWMLTSQLENKSWFYQKWMPSWTRGSYEKKWLRTKFRMEISNVQMEKCCTTRAIHLSPLSRNDLMRIWSSLNSKNLMGLLIWNFQMIFYENWKPKIKSGSVSGLIFNFYKTFFAACDKIKKAWICNECKKPELSHACYGDITDFRRRRRAVLWTDREATNHELAKTFSGISSIL